MVESVNAEKHTIWHNIFQERGERGIERGYQENLKNTPRRKSLILHFPVKNIDFRKI